MRTPFTLHRGAAATAGSGMLLLLAGCALATAVPPTVQVENVQLAALGFPKKAVTLTLSVSNPNHSEMAFGHIGFRLDVNGRPFADGAVPSAVQIAPNTSMLVLVNVATTVANLGPQLLATLSTGWVAYTLSGSVGLAGLPFDVPFSRDGSPSVLTTGLSLLQATETPVATLYGAPVIALA